jgi:hypothetical protein
MTKQRIPPMGCSCLVNKNRNLWSKKGASSSLAVHTTGQIAIVTIPNMDNIG